MPKNTRRHLTKSQCEKAQPRIGGRYILWDDDPKGLGLRITEYGAKSWVFVYRVNGQQTWMTLENCPTNDPAPARKAAHDAIYNLGMERDPAQIARDKRLAESGADRFKALVTRYLADPETRALRTVAGIERQISKHLLPAWGSRKAKDISPADVMALIENYAATKPVAANRLLSVAREVFDFGKRKLILTSNPASVVEKSKENNVHHRAASDVEISKLWLALDSEPAPLAAAYRLLALTGCRRAEVWDAKWSEIDLQNNVWTIPAARTKNGREHRIPLVGMALEIITALKSLPRTGDFLFPDKMDRKTAYPLSRLHQRICTAADVKDFQIHGLRSTVASGLGNLGTLAEIISRVLNHTTGKEGQGSKITLVYNQHHYDGPKRAALELWDQHVRGLTATASAASGAGDDMGEVVNVA
jgi:integrase